MYSRAQFKTTRFLPLYKSTYTSRASQVTCHSLHEKYISLILVSVYRKFKLNLFFHCQINSELLFTEIIDFTIRLFSQKH